MSNPALNFVAAGIGCNAFTLLDRTKIIDKLITKQKINRNSINKKHYKNPAAIIMALVTLEKLNVLKRQGNYFLLTLFGNRLVHYRGLITMLFEGYGDLLSHQIKIQNGALTHIQRLINGESIALSSIQFGEEKIDPLVLSRIKKYKIKNTICDLGCGTGEKLIKIVKSSKLKALGIEYNNKAIKVAKSKVKRIKNITIVKGDITKLEKVWYDVELLTQFFVMHDFTPTKKCLKILNSLLKVFPNVQYFFYVDIVSPSQTKDSIMPGFDYVHRLQGIVPRTYEETIKMFNVSKFQLIEEIPIKTMPNTFFWILAPNK